MKLESVTKMTKETSNIKKFDNDVMSAKCGVIVNLPIYGQFGAIRKEES